jgi:hypothetical protein
MEKRRKISPLMRCSPSDDLVEELGMIRVIEPKFVAGTRVDPIRIARSLPSNGEQRLFTSIYRNINLAGTLAQGVPRNGRSTFYVASRDWIRESGDNRGDFDYEDDERCDMYAFEL